MPSKRWIIEYLKRRWLMILCDHRWIRVQNYNQGKKKGLREYHCILCDASKFFRVQDDSFNFEDE